MLNSEYPQIKSRYLNNDATTTPIITGVVTSVNPNGFTVTVVTGNNKLHTGVPILNLYGTYLNQDLTWLKSLNGTNVALIWLADRYYVLATIPFETVDALKREDKIGEERLEFPSGFGLEGGKDEDTYNKLTYKNYSGRRANDFFDGDKILRADGNSEVSVLRGGVAKLKGGPLSQIIFSKFKDLGMLVTRVFKHFSDFGEINFTHNDKGRVGMHLKGGADYKTETHPTKELWTVQAWVGDCPQASKNARLHIKVNDPHKSEYVTMIFDTRGNISLDTSKSEFVDIGKNSETNIKEDKSLTIGKNFFTDVKNKYTLNIGADKEVTVRGSEKRTVKSMYNLTVSGNCNIKSSGAVNITGGSQVSVKGPMIRFN